MKRFAIIIALNGILFCIFSCDAGKSGPFTFTNKTDSSINVIITQDGTVEKNFTAGEKYRGKDYYTPQIAFVKNIDTAENKKIIDNRFTATSNNGFDYELEKATSQKLVISANLGGDYQTNTAIKDCYLAEVNGKLGEYSNTTIKLADVTNPSSPSQVNALYTSNPQFRMYRDKTVGGKTEREDLTSIFALSLGKSEIPPVSGAPEGTKSTLQWNLVISYPKVKPVE